MKGRRREPLNLQPDKSVRDPGTHAGSLSEDSLVGRSPSPASATREALEWKGFGWRQAGGELREPRREPSVCSHSTLALLSLSVDVAPPRVRPRTLTHRRLTRGRLRTPSRGHSEFPVRPHVLSDHAYQEATRQRARRDFAGRWEGSIRPPR